MAGHQCFGGPCCLHIQVVTSCCDEVGYQCFGGPCCLHLHITSLYCVTIQMTMSGGVQPKHWSLSLAKCDADWPPKRWCRTTTLLGVTTQKTSTWTKKPSHNCSITYFTLGLNRPLHAKPCKCHLRPHFVDARLEIIDSWRRSADGADYTRKPVYETDTLHTRNKLTA
jgi:hypothetical protein